MPVPNALDQLREQARALGLDPDSLWNTGVSTSAPGPGAMPGSTLSNHVQDYLAAPMDTPWVSELQGRYDKQVADTNQMLAAAELRGSGERFAGIPGLSTQGDKAKWWNYERPDVGPSEEEMAKAKALDIFTETTRRAPELPGVLKPAVDTQPVVGDDNPNRLTALKTNQVNRGNSLRANPEYQAYMAYEKAIQSAMNAGNMKEAKRLKAERSAKGADAFGGGVIQSSEKGAFGGGKDTEALRQKYLDDRRAKGGYIKGDMSTRDLALAKSPKFRATDMRRRLDAGEQVDAALVFDALGPIAGTAALESAKARQAEAQLQLQSALTAMQSWGETYKAAVTSGDATMTAFAQQGYQAAAAAYQSTMESLYGGGAMPEEVEVPGQTNSFGQPVMPAPKLDDIKQGELPPDMATQVGPDGGVKFDIPSKRSEDRRYTWEGFFGEDGRLQWPIGIEQGRRPTFLRKRQPWEPFDPYTHLPE